MGRANAGCCQGCFDITVENLLNPRFSDALLWNLKARDIEPQRPVLEILRSALYVTGTDGILEASNQLVSSGFSFALDDFGTGHASDLSLVNLPVDLVKIDRAFVSGVGSDRQKRSLVSSMIDMATNLRIEVLADGVESDADVKVLQDMWCRLFQAFHFGHPMPQEAAPEWILEREVHRPPPEMNRGRA
ncbi:EAL domain-containing protein [Loktanella sp. IMCC34160]|uniref:EAL domain-containing protein n=1 Tax=Loktanella sp. IMCC34160 TaxID=2510646 RepID=UPI0024140FB3|nr:EAL domain-containing protein [Loktanella sp. IMCC34160]